MPGRKANSKPLLSLCMIVKNEEHNLPRSLASVGDLADQIVIVDTGSTDHTVEIARQFKAEVYFFPWQNDFSAARNESLKYARGEWILILDADDELTKAAQTAIPNLINDSEYDAYGLIIRNLAEPSDLVKYVDDVRYRLFRNGKGFRYEKKVHNQIAPSIIRNGGKARDTDLVILHYGYLENPRAKAERSLPMIQSALQDDPNNVYLIFKLAETLKALGDNQASLNTFYQLFESNYLSLPVDIIATAYMRMAQLELKFDRYVLCLEHARASHRLKPDNPIPPYLVGIAAMYLGEIDQALEYFDSVEKNYSDDYFDKTDLKVLRRICQSVQEKSCNNQPSEG